MLKKRVIFTLLYNNGLFVLSRNFRLQKVGNIDWLKINYDFSKISFYIDELLVLDVTRGRRDLGRFLEELKLLTKGCFVPIAAGGGIHSVEAAAQLLRSGADKIVINTALFSCPSFLSDMAKEFGQQCIIGSLDIKKHTDNEYHIFTNNGSKMICGRPQDLITKLPINAIGELYLNSVDQDGTSQGYDLGLLDLLPKNFELPIILAGGVGNTQHLLSGLLDHRVEAVATANLFNFVGDGLMKARQSLVAQGQPLANWPTLQSLKVELAEKGVTIL